MSKKSVKRSVPFITVKSYIQASPKGNVLIISPWNFPFNLTLNPLISALSAGNIVIIKASEKSPHTTSLLKRIVNELFKEKEVALIEGDATVGRTLTDLPLNHIFFTGNEEIGKKVMKAAANNLCSTTLELGGANPVIIDKSSDLSDTAEKLVWGKFLNAGQSCLAPNHIFIDKEMKTNFIMELKAALMKLYPHPIDDFDLYHDFGRIINLDHCHKLVQLYEENKMDGVTILGGKYDIQKRYFSPTIIDDLKFESKFMTQEIFGPILGIYSYNDLDNVINYINTQSKPLCLYIFSKSRKNIETIKSKSQSGMICVNDTTIPFVVPNIPFGGDNTSGIGKCQGQYGFEAFSNMRSVSRQNLGLSTVKLLYPPYELKTLKRLKLIRKLFYD